MIRIFDADKKPVTAEIQRTDRVDVNQLFEEAKNPGKTGFFAEITNVSGKCLYVVFYAGDKKTVHVVPLRKADILVKKIDKYVEKGIRYWKSQGATALAEKVVTKIKNVRQGRRFTRSGSGIICRTGVSLRNKGKQRLHIIRRFLL